MLNHSDGVCFMFVGKSLKYLVLKSEIRSTKHETNPNDKNPKLKDRKHTGIRAQEHKAKISVEREAYSG